MRKVGVSIGCVLALAAMYQLGYYRGQVSILSGGKATVVSKAETESPARGSLEMHAVNSPARLAVALLEREAIGSFYKVVPWQ